MSKSDKLELNEVQENLTGEERPAVSKGRMTGPLAFAMCAAAFGSSWTFGYNIGVINMPKDVVQKWINESHYRMFNEGLDDDRADNIWSAVVSMFCVGGMAGGLVSGAVATRFGRKGGMLFNCIFSFLAAALLGFSKMSGSYITLMIGRIAVGFNAGLNTGLAPMYLVEIAPNNLRGALGTLHQLVVTVSILFSMLVGTKDTLGTETYWPLLFALTAAPTIYQLIALPFCPETPKYLLINKGLNEAAEKSLSKLRQSESVQQEMDEMIAENAQVKKAPTVKFMELFTNPDLKWPLFIAVMMMFSQQLSGINVAMFYSSEIFKSAGLNVDEAQYATIAMGVINVLMTVVSTALVDRYGRRFLHLVGMAGMWLTSLLLVICLSYTPTIVEFAGNSTHNATTQLVGGDPAASYAAIIFVLLFVISFATGPGSIPWFYVSELFLLGARSHANSVAVVANWTAALVVAQIFLPMKNAIDQYSFLFFTVCLTFFIWFTWMFVPETKGRPVDEIVESMKKQKRYTGAGD